MVLGRAEARRFGPELERSRLVGMDRLRAGEELVLGLAVVRVGHAAVDRADLGALLLGVEADALGAQAWVDDEGLLALADGLVRALRLAHAAVDAFLGDHGRHGGLLRIPRSAAVAPVSGSPGRCRAGGVPRAGARSPGRGGTRARRRRARARARDWSPGAGGPAARAPSAAPRAPGRAGPRPASSGSRRRGGRRGPRQRRRRAGRSGPGPREARARRRRSGWGAGAALRRAPGRSGR